MHFDGLVRKFPSLLSLAGDSDFEFLKKSLMDKVVLYSEGFKSGTEALGTSNWASLINNPPILSVRLNSIELDEFEKSSLDALIVKILKVFPEEHRLVLCQAVWLKDGQVVPKHIDSKAIFHYFKRVNLIVKKSGMKYFVFKGRFKPEEIRCDDGDLFELNNRAYHQVENTTFQTAVLLTFDFIPLSHPEIPQSFITNDDFRDVDKTHKSPTVIMGY